MSADHPQYREYMNGAGAGVAPAAPPAYDPTKSGDNYYDYLRSLWYSPVQQQGGALDAFSTSVPWREEAPTGGLYGAYDWLTNMGQTGSEAALQNTLQQGASSQWNPSSLGLNAAFLNYATTPGEAEAAQLAGYKGMLGQGYSDAELAAIQGAGADTTRAGLASAQANMENRIRKSGQTTGGYGAMADMALGGANAMAKQARDTQILQAQEKQRRTEAGLQGLGSSAATTANRTQYGGTQAANLLNAGAQQQQGYASLLQNQQNALRQGQQYGLGGQQNLYNATSGRASGTYQQLQNLLSQQMGGISQSL